MSREAVNDDELAQLRREVRAMQYTVEALSEALDLQSAITRLAQALTQFTAVFSNQLTDAELLEFTSRRRELWKTPSSGSHCNRTTPGGTSPPSTARTWLSANQHQRVNALWPTAASPNSGPNSPTPPVN